MTKKNYIQQCLERAEKATPEPWDVMIRRHTSGNLGITLETWHASGPDVKENKAKLDAEFIAHARTDVPLLANKLLWVIEILRGHGFDAIADELESPLEGDSNE